MKLNSSLNLLHPSTPCLSHGISVEILEIFLDVSSSHAPSVIELDHLQMHLDSGHFSPLAWSSPWATMRSSLEEVTVPSN